MHDNVRDIKTNQAKLLLNELQFEKFEQARQSVGITQKATAAREFTLLGIEVIELFQSRASSPEAVLYELHSALMELDIRRMEQSAAANGAQSRTA